MASAWRVVVAVLCGLAAEFALRRLIRRPIAALEAGKHVIVEKPMAMSAKEGQAMLDAAKRAGKQLIVGFQHRFDAKTKLMAIDGAMINMLTGRQQP